MDANSIHNDVLISLLADKPCEKITNGKAELRVADVEKIGTAKRVIGTVINAQ